jgi:hypothetical protein
MEKSNENSSGINSILVRARIYNSEIGSYQEHFINERFGYTIRLSNGRIEIPMNMAKDQEVMPQSISEDRIMNVANNFVNNNPKQVVKVIPEEIVVETKTIIKLTFWQKFLKLIGIK